jgi:hypothetical protein
VQYSLGILFEKRLLAVSTGFLQGNAILFPEAKSHSLSACVTLSRDDRQRKSNILGTSQSPTTLRLATMIETMQEEQPLDCYG